MAEYGINGTTLNLQAIQLKCKNASQWTSTDVLLAGEVGVELDTHKAKIGDGSTTWGNLDYSSDPTIAGLVDSLTERVTTAEGTLESIGTRLTTAEGNITAAQSDISSQGTRLTAAEGNITAAQGNITTLQGDMTQAKSDITQAQSDISTNAGNISSHGTRLDALEGITILSSNPFRS